MNKINAILQQLKRNATAVIPEAELAAKLERSVEKPLRVKLGIDPSAPHLTLGHAVVLRKLRQFQELGHTAVLIVGDFTRLVGDPSERTSTRPLMSKEQVQANMQTYRQQAFKILDPKKTEVRFNSEWLAPLGVEGMIKLASKYTVARMLERDDFSKRFKENLPISVLEFLYPLLQAYDSVAVQADVELGGHDQLFNLLIGRDIQREYGLEPQVALTMTLLIGTDGAQAMGQSKGNYIGVDEPPEQIFGKTMSLPDELMQQYYELLTDIPWETVKDMHPKQCKMKLGHTLVAWLHNEAAAETAEAEFDRVFSQRKTPTHVEELKDAAKLKDSLKEVNLDSHGRIKDARFPIIALLAKSGAVKSNSEARRLIEQGAVEIDGIKITEIHQNVSIKPDSVIRVGKKRFFKIDLEAVTK